MERVLVLGVNGLIGSAIFNYLNQKGAYQVHGTVRSLDLLKNFKYSLRDRVLTNIDALRYADIDKVISDVSPTVVINCIGVTKHLAEGNNPLVAIPTNALLPYALDKICGKVSARLIHISSDCVFSGRAGSYTESDCTDADDIYGRSKALGEIRSSCHTVTLRTSTIGHEFDTKFGLLEWFLDQHATCQGYKHAIFSGLPTIELARVIGEYVIPNAELSGLYNVGGNPISKYDLLTIISEIYKKNIEIIPEEDFRIDRSLNSNKFRAITGYEPNNWKALIEYMFDWRGRV